MRQPKHCAFCGEKLQVTVTRYNAHSYNIYNGNQLLILSCPNDGQPSSSSKQRHDNALPLRHSWWAKIPDQFNENEYFWKEI